MKLGALDIGTNTALLLLGEVREPGTLTILADLHGIPRLGEGVDKTRVISDAAYARLSSVLKGHIEVANQHGISNIRAVATSAMRDAANSTEIVEQVIRDLGIQVDIISGEREAELTYLGGTLGHNTSADTILLDIGGGSTEISNMRNGRVRGCSINIGAVRQTERFLKTSPADPGKLVEARALIRESLDKPEVPTEASRLIAVAGTPTTLTAIAMGLNVFDRNRINGSTLSLEKVQSLSQELAETSIVEILHRYPVIDKARADILLAGTLILEAVMLKFNLGEVTVSTRGLRYGVLLNAFEESVGAPDKGWRVIDQESS